VEVVKVDPQSVLNTCLSPGDKICDLSLEDCEKMVKATNEDNERDITIHPTDTSGMRSIVADDDPALKC
jgi:hypothetical protein